MGRINRLLEKEMSFSAVIIKNNAGGERGLDLAFASKKKMKKETSRGLEATEISI